MTLIDLQTDHNIEKDSRVAAALKAWNTIRMKKMAKLMRENRPIDFYLFDVNVDRVSYGSYRINPPLIKASRLTSVGNGGVGKELSDGWAINYAVGCTHACRFCYVDNIHKRFSIRYGDLVNRSWGMYLMVPENIEEAIEKTGWWKWRGKEVMMSSTHDPYLPQLYNITRKILEKSLPYGVKYLIQTRSTLVTKDLSLLSKYRNQIRLQVSIATLDEEFAKIIEPRVPSPEARLNILKEAKEAGIVTGIIVAPVFPKKDWRKDVEEVLKKASEVKVDHVYGEALHVRGINLDYIKEAVSSKKSYLDLFERLNSLSLYKFDKKAGALFEALLKTYHLNGRWWYECQNKGKVITTGGNKE
ncbi:MAG: radical SAM protein [Nitrososphaeria archaeon]